FGTDQYQVDRNTGEFIEPYEKPKPIVTEAYASLNQNDQGDQSDKTDLNYLNDQNDNPVQADEILNDDQPEYSNHNNDEHIIDNLTNTKDVQISEPPSSSTKDTSAPNAGLTVQTVSPSSITSIATSSPQDRWSREKHIELANIVGNPGTGMLTGQWLRN
ncbi:hypothetical protein Tco_0039399, partial [Tanacetum coccineum]